MANTTNLNLVKLSGSEKLKNYPTNQAGNMDTIDSAFGAGFGLSGNPSVNTSINNLADGLAIIANGNTHAAITSGQYVYVRNHGSLSEGLYVATANISANGTLSGSNLTANSNGGLNALNSKMNVYFSTLAEFKSYASAMKTYESVNFCGNTEVSNALSGNSTMIAGTMVKVSASAIDITWASNIGYDVGSARYNINTDVFIVNNINSNVATKTKKLELTSSGTNLDAVLHAWMGTHRDSMTTGEMACTTGIFSGTIYYGLIVKVAAKVMVGTMFTPASSNGFRFRDSSDDTSATHTDFTL